MEVAHCLLSDVCEVYDDTYHVALLAVIFFFTIWVLDVFFPIVDAGREVIEVCHIDWICQHIIEGDAMDRFLWDLDFLHPINYYLISKREIVVFFEVVGLFDKPWGITKLDCIKEVRQILVHLNYSFLLCHEEIFERLSEQEVQSDKDQNHRGNEVLRRGLVQEQ